MSSAQREKKSEYTYRLRLNVESNVIREFNAEQAKLPIKEESESEDEQGNGISTNTDESLLTTNLKMTCSDNEDQPEDCDNRHHAAVRSEIAVLMPSHKLAEASVSNALSMIAKQIESMVDNITAIEDKTDHMEMEMAHISKRLGRVEKKVGISLATLEQVKDSVVFTVDDGARPEDSDQSVEPAQARFVFKKVSTEEELTAFDTKLGEDEEYYRNLKQWLLVQLPDSKPNNRMHIALDLLLERSFFAQCNWSGISKKEPKVRFGNRTNIFKLFAEIGSDKPEALAELQIHIFFKDKLNHAKERARKKSMASRVYIRKKVPRT